MPINYTGSGGGVPRKTAKIFASNAASADMTVFGSTLGGNTQYTTDLDSIQSSRYETGWRDAVVSNLNYPLLSDMNAVQHTLSQQIAYTLQHGIPEYDSGTTYYAYDKVQYNDIIYTALQDNFSNINPSNTSYWAVYYSPGTYANVDLNNLTSTGENHFANKDLSNLTATGEKHFINKTQVTNCILEAPNGVWTTSGATLTVKSGLKVLIPNGRNTDGTLNNNEFRLNADVTYTYGFNTNLINEYIFMRADNQIQRLNGNFVFYVTAYAQLGTQTGNNQYRIAYVENNNLWYMTTNTGTTWTAINMCPIGKLSVRNTNVIYDSRPDYELSLANASLTSKTIINTTLPFPSDWLYIDLPFGASGSDLIAPADGYFEVYKDGADQTDFVCLAQILSNGATGNQAVGISTVSNCSVQHPTQGYNYLHINLPCKKGQKVNLTYRGAGAIEVFRFIYAKGEE